MVYNFISAGFVYRAKIKNGRMACNQTAVKIMRDLLKY